MKPNGMINFDRLAGKDLLIAEREGAANCMTVLKFKDNHTFIERNVCFGIKEIKGSYEIKGDTLLFINVHVGRMDESYYPYAVVKNPDTLVLYGNNKDLVSRALRITKNELNLFTIQSAQAP